MGIDEDSSRFEDAFRVRFALFGARHRAGFAEHRVPQGYYYAHNDRFCLMRLPVALTI
jgi:hypothetical protein